MRRRQTVAQLEATARREALARRRRYVTRKRRLRCPRCGMTYAPTPSGKMRRHRRMFPWVDSGAQPYCAGGGR